MPSIECTCGDGACMLCDDNGMQHHVRVSRDPEKNWANDDIQFPRLLAEIYSTIELSDAQWEELCMSMDLDRERVLELFERADATWQSIKERV